MYTDSVTVLRPIIHIHLDNTEVLTVVSTAWKSNDQVRSVMMAAASGLREMANHTRVNVMAAFRANGHARTAPQGSIVKPGASIKTQLEKAAHSGLTRALSLPDSTAIVVGIVIGAGIFLIPKLVAQATPSIPAILCMWVLGGVVCFLGALGYAELGAMMPLSGGHYVYLRECYGPLCGFLCGWTFVLVVAGAAIAWLAVSFSITLGYFVRLGPVASKERCKKALGKALRQNGAVGDLRFIQLDTGMRT